MEFAQRLCRYIQASAALVWHIMNPSQDYCFCLSRPYSCVDLSNKGPSLVRLVNLLMFRCQLESHPPVWHIIRSPFARGLQCDIRGGFGIHIRSLANVNGTISNTTMS